MIDPASKPDYVLVHSDCRTEMDGLHCPKCQIYPDMQSTEFWRPTDVKAPPAPILARPVYRLTQDNYGVWWIKGSVHHIWMTKRPSYCDRGHYIAHVEPAPGAGHEYSIDESDLWPRYFMGFTRMVDEMCAWLDWREGDGPKEAGRKTFDFREPDFSG